MTAQDLIKSSMRLAKILGSGQSPTSIELDDALVTLNQRISNLSAKGIAVPYVSGDAFTLTGAGFYTIGTGSTINTARPLVIKYIKITVSNVARKVKVVTAEEWADIKDFSRASKFAEKALYNVTSPTAGGIYLWPTPASGGVLDVQSLKALTQFATLAGTVSLPEGYEMALRALLALDLCPEYEMRASEELVAMAKDALDTIIGLNAAVLGTPPSLAQQEPAQ